jgi:hypothetical protein
MGKLWKITIFNGEININQLYLGGGWYNYPSEKCEFVRWGYYSQYMESHKIPWFQSPPTSFLRLSAPARLSS